MLHKPYKYEVKRGNGPGTTTTLLVDGEKFDLRRLYRFPRVNARFVPVMSVTETILRPMSEAQEAKNAQTRFMVGLLASNILGNAIEQSQKRSQEIEQTLEDDIRAIDNANTQINYANAQVLPLLTSVTGQQFGADPKPWQGVVGGRARVWPTTTDTTTKSPHTQKRSESNQVPVIVPTVSTSQLPASPRAHPSRPWEAPERSKHSRRRPRIVPAPDDRCPFVSTRAGHHGAV